MLFLFAEEVEFGGIVLEDVRADTVAYACAASGDDVGLAREVGNVLIRIECVVAEHLEESIDRNRNTVERKLCR